MTRIIVAGLVVTSLALGIWLLWPTANTASDTATTVVASPAPNTTTAPTSTTTSQPATTTSTVSDSHVVETVAEAEEILRELWFGWFEGIYNQDEDRIREVVANPAQIEAAVGQFGQLAFSATPTDSAILITQADILHADEQCLAIWASMDATSLTGGELSGVHTFRILDDRWVFISLWANPGDLWKSDCDAQL